MKNEFISLRMGTFLTCVEGLKFVSRKKGCRDLKRQAFTLKTIITAFLTEIPSSDSFAFLSFFYEEESMLQIFPDNNQRILLLDFSI